MLPSLGSVVLDLAGAVVAELARQPGDRPARNGLALAPQRLVRAVALSLARSLARRAAQDRTRDPSSDHTDGPRELSLGCATDPWRASHARFQRVPSHRVALYARRKPATGTIVADFSSQSSPRLPLRRGFGECVRQGVPMPACPVLPEEGRALRSWADCAGRRAPRSLGRLSTAPA
jgi:hypothetical protein